MIRYANDTFYYYLDIKFYILNFLYKVCYQESDKLEILTVSASNCYLVSASMTEKSVKLTKRKHGNTALFSN